jgi:hypothetical protein
MLALVLTATWAAAAGPGAERRATATVAGAAFRLEVATTADEHRHGLMNRLDIPADGGMLFVFDDEQVRQFWMAYTLVNLDILFLDGRGVVVAMHRMRTERPRTAVERDEDYHERLPRYSSHKPAMYAIELRHGTLERLGVTVGDTVELCLDERTR